MDNLQSLISRLERMRGPYMGDGINPGFTTTEVLGFLRQLKTLTDAAQTAIVTTLETKEPQ